ncbi:hypothetical protein J3F83DRAFT_750781 [Trichoderma novae-zelandiae]
MDIHAWTYSTCKTPLPGEPAGCDKSQCPPSPTDPNHVVSPTIRSRPPATPCLARSYSWRGTR